MSELSKAAFDGVIDGINISKDLMKGAVKGAAVGAFAMAAIVPAILVGMDVSGIIGESRPLIESLSELKALKTDPNYISMVLKGGMIGTTIGAIRETVKTKLKP